MKRRNLADWPETDAEWQDAVNAAHGALLLVAASAYGIINGGPQINEERCEKILAAGAERQIYPAADALDRFVEEIVANNA